MSSISQAASATTNFAISVLLTRTNMVLSMREIGNGKTGTLICKLGIWWLWHWLLEQGLHFLRPNSIAQEVSLDGGLSLRKRPESTSQEGELISMGNDTYRNAIHEMP